jgi:hypothetical protein
VAVGRLAVKVTLQFIGAVDAFAAAYWSGVVADFLS